MSAAPSPSPAPLLHQASCVAIGGRALLIEGPPGSGKSSLALALIDRGAMLVGDDGVALEPRGGRLWALPPPNIRGLIEVRHVALLTLPVTEAPVALLLTLDPTAPRLPEGAHEAVRAGITLPALAIDPRAPVPHLRAEAALRLFGHV